MNFLVVSRTHSLLPLAYRLQRGEHQPTDVVVWKRRFERAWTGKLAVAAQRNERGEVGYAALADYVHECSEGTRVFISDAKLRDFPRHGLYYGTLPSDDSPRSSLRLGGWYTGEEMVNPHLLVADLGAWPGGLGQQVLGGMTMVLPSGEADIGEAIDSLLGPLLEHFKASNFRGLFNVGVDADEMGAPQVVGWEAGWPFLHTHAWLSDLTNLSSVLMGTDAPRHDLEAKYTTVVPVSVPPWPVVQAVGTPPRPVEGLTPQQQGRVFWHDVVIGEQGHKVDTAGLDGLVGVVRGAARQPELSRRRAQEIAQRVVLAEKQYRPDAGALVPQALATLEAAWGVVL